MVKLTESIILTRTKQHEVDRVKKLNCWFGINKKKYFEIAIFNVLCFIGAVI